MDRPKIYKQIMDSIREKPPKSINQISNNTGVRWETVNNAMDVFLKLGLVEYSLVDKKYYWAVVPYNFFQKYKERKEKYIHELEMRLLELKWGKKKKQQK